MPKLSPEVRDARRQQIAEAMLRCIRRNGLAKTSMADIIKESGLSAGSIYSHFEGRADLLKYAAGTLVHTRGARLREASERARTPREVGRLMVTEVLPHELRSVMLQVWAEAAADAELQPVIQHQLRAVWTMVRDALLPWAQTQGTSDVEALASIRADAVLAAMQGHLVRVTLDPEIDRERLLENVLAPLEG